MFSLFALSSVFLLAHAQNPIFDALAKSEDALKQALTSVDQLALMINAQGHAKQTPLMSASLSGNLRAVELLLEHGADPNIGEKDGYTPLHGAAFQGRASVARFLLEKPSIPNVMHKDGFFAVHRSCWGQEKRHTDTLKVFLEGGEYSRVTKDGKSVLDVCLKAGNKASIALVSSWGSPADEL